ncbi:hypothetical protein FANTH_2813 [Fusarium anthophilum]|uniref:Uncharacterized protein n=1 Tax=Fusarium anthophilum TaxID=48485 RepID=A0A8H4ZTS9_9HYPO|nr:hypothetical protein FANTH_2813 [Fusarium anthophilum]
MSINTAQQLILQHSTNPVNNPGYETRTDKAWARAYKPIKKVTSHTMAGADGRTYADFEDAILPLQADDESRFRQGLCRRIAGIGGSRPKQTPISEENIAENVDCVFSVRMGNTRRTVAIGEMKRNLLEEDWQDGTIVSASQKKLSQELRGYAYKYRCPQVFCFDGSLLILLQFRAYRLESLKDEACPVDCWTIPIEGSSCSLWYGLYRLLAQGWRRCQGEFASPFTVGGFVPCSREFYTGLPIWEINGGRQNSHPTGYQRAVHNENGALIWTHNVNPTEWETGAFW